MAAAQIARFRQPASSGDAEQAATLFLSQHLKGPASHVELVESLLERFSAEQTELERQLLASQANLDGLLTRTRESLSLLQHRADRLHAAHLQLEDDMIDQRNAFRSPDGSAPALLQQLETMQQHLGELHSAKAYFAILEQAEHNAKEALQQVKRGHVDSALSAYIKLVGCCGAIPAAEGEASNGSLHAKQLVSAMALETFQSLRTILSTKLHAVLDKERWPANKDQQVIGQDILTVLRGPFIDLMRLQTCASEHPIAELADLQMQPLIAISALAHPFVLRFRFHFEGQRQTNRLDKPEWFLVNILNAVSDQERFLREDIKPLLKAAGYQMIDPFADFVEVLTDAIMRKLRQITPQLLSMPPIFAHTIYQTLEFDETLRKRYDFLPRGSTKPWPGTVEAILGRQDWLDQWRDAEKKYADDRYYEIISAADAWQLNEDFGPANRLRPTNSSLRVRDLCDQITERYRPLPLFSHRLPFLVDVQLPLLDAYQSRIASAVDAFETLSFGLMRAVPGALGETSHNRLTAGVSGLQRIIRAEISARWMESVCSAWSEDVFFLELWSEIRQRASTDPAAKAALQNLGSTSGTLFAAYVTRFAHLAERIDGLIVKHVIREVSNELKQYFNKRWDNAVSEDGSEISLSPEMLSALSTFSALLSSLAASMPVVSLQLLYRQTAQHLTSDVLLPRIAMSKVFAYPGGRQFAFDVSSGWETAGRQAGIRQPAAGFAKLCDAAKLLSLPAGPDGELSRVSQVAWDDNDQRYKEAMVHIGVASLTKKEVQNVLKRRSEVWR